MTTWRLGKVPRTGDTTLEDDELIILDIIFARRIRDILLRHSDQSEVANLPYEHGISVERMPTILQGLARRGIITETMRDAIKLIGLTPTGGSLWERERLPKWEAYCWEGRRNVDGHEMLLIRAVEGDVATAFFDVGCKAGLWSSLSEPVIEIDDQLGITSWKEGRLVVLKVPIARSPATTDWGFYESRRVWWRTVPELLRSYGVLMDPSVADRRPPPLYSSRS